MATTHAANVKRDQMQLDNERVQWKPLIEYLEGSDYTVEYDGTEIVYSKQIDDLISKVSIFVLDEVMADQVWLDDEGEDVGKSTFYTVDQIDEFIEYLKTMSYPTQYECEIELKETFYAKSVEHARERFMNKIDCTACMTIDPI